MSELKMKELHFFLLIQLSSYCGSERLIFDVSQDGGCEVPHFWKSTGFSPTDPFMKRSSLFNKDVQLNLALIGALPRKGIEYVRIHWLINLISINNEREFEFINLNRFIDSIILHNLKPGFELMGRPSNYMEEKHKDIYKFWKEMVFEMLNNFLERYGYEEVIDWRFETWNEPDLKIYNIYNFTIKDYLSYVKGCSDGMKEAFLKSKSSGNRKRIRFGGPAGLFKDKTHHPLCWGFMDYCFNVNHQNKCPITFVSFHKKGNGSPETVLKEDIDLIVNFTRRYGTEGFKKISIAIDEADILTNWSLSEDWRGDARYAAMIIKVIVDHFKQIIKERKIKIEVLSNDNGFLNYHPFYFTQRTLLTRFQINNTNPPHVQFIQKPVYAAMGLLSLLENRFIHEKTDLLNPNSNCTSILATKFNSTKSFRFSSVIAFNAAGNRTNCETSFRIQIRNIPNITTNKYAIYAIDSTNTNPYLTWKTSGRPAFPNKKLRENMREKEGPFYLKHPTDVGLTSKLNLEMYANQTSIYLIQICSFKNKRPGKPTQLKAFNLYFGETLLTWSDRFVKTKCILSYEIEVETVCLDGLVLPFVKCNVKPVLFLSHQYVRNADNITCNIVEERFRVRAKDFWNRAGNYSRVVSLFTKNKG